jgi:hypothetical protein
MLADKVHCQPVAAPCVFLRFWYPEFRVNCPDGHAWAHSPAGVGRLPVLSAGRLEAPVAERASSVVEGDALATAGAGRPEVGTAAETGPRNRTRRVALARARLSSFVAWLVY